MTIARHYRMDAAEGKAEELLTALNDLAEGLKPVPGFVGADLMRDVDQPHRFVFIEKWTSVEAHKAGGPLLPKEVLGRLMGTLSGKPDGAYLAYLPLG